MLPICDLNEMQWIECYLFYRQEYSMSFGMSYSCVIDWHVDFVPRRRHRLARAYDNPAWCCQRTSAFAAIQGAMDQCEKLLIVEDGE